MRMSPVLKSVHSNQQLLIMHVILRIHLRIMEADFRGEN